MNSSSKEGNVGEELAHQIDVQWAIEPEPWMPDDQDIERWAVEVLKTIQAGNAPSELCVRIVSASEIQSLNCDYREIDKVTNVLSFPQSVDVDLETKLLGDIVICAAVVSSEAQIQKKEPQAHFAHLIVHGMLHLLGYDHLEDDEAEEMERTEVSILRGLGVDDPYQQELVPNESLER